MRELQLGASGLRKPTATPTADGDAVDVTLAASGDGQAFERLYRAHVARIHSLAILNPPALVIKAHGQNWANNQKSCESRKQVCAELKNKQAGSNGPGNCENYQTIDKAG